MSETNRHLLRWSGRTHPGRFRTSNEDAFLALRFDFRETQLLGKDGELPVGDWDYVFAVSDGMGGANAGEFASRIAVERISMMLPVSFRLAAAGLHNIALDMLSELFSGIDEAMREMGQHYEECAGMGATLSLCWFGPRRMLFAHIGDSRIYYLPANQPLIQISRDHCRIWRLMKSGKIGFHEYLNHPERHVLEQALGGRSQTMDPQIGVVEYAPGDAFVLCTDGVSNGVFERRFETLWRNPPASLAELPTAERYIVDGLDAGGRDNLTAITVEVC